MAAILSSMLPLGTKAPDFKLYNPTADLYQSLDELKSKKATVVVFMCNHCPYVIHILKKFVEISDKYIQHGISFIAVNPNDVIKYPDDSPEKMKELAENYNFNFSYLYDETQSTAIKYKAACTPDFFVFDKDMFLVYRGQFDNSRPNNGVPVSGIDLSNALDAILNGKEIDSEQFPSIGCSIKWKN